MLILFAGEGRLGNQVFQYVALSTVAGKDSLVIAAGLEDLARGFELLGPRCRVVPGGLWMKRLVKYLLRPLLLLPVSRWLRLVSYAREPETGGAHRGHDGRLLVRWGLLRSVLFVDGGYYQNSDYWPELFPPRALRLREQWRDEARRLLGSVGDSRPLFLHVRRSDYVGYTPYGLRDLLLPMGYFREAIAEARARLGPRPLLIVTDDPQWVEREFADVPDRTVISGQPMVDFAVMAECAGGILSNSSFSLAAAMFVRDPEIVLGPRYWFGFRVREWLPPRIRFEDPRISYLDVQPRAIT